MDAGERLQWEIFWRTVTPFPDKDFADCLNNPNSIALSVDQINKQINRAKVYQHAAQMELLEIQRRRLQKHHDEFAAGWEDSWPYDDMEPLDIRGHRNGHEIDELVGSQEQIAGNNAYKPAMTENEHQVLKQKKRKRELYDTINDVYIQSRRELRQTQQMTFLMLRSIQQEEMFTMWRQRAAAELTWSHVVWHGLLTKGRDSFRVRALTRDNVPLPTLPDNLLLTQRCQLAEAALLLTHPKLRLFLIQAETPPSSTPVTGDDATSTDAQAASSKSTEITDSNSVEFSDQIVHFLHQHHYAAIVPLSNNSKLHLLPVTKLHVPGSVPPNLLQHLKETGTMTLLAILAPAPSTPAIDLDKMDDNTDQALAPLLGNIDRFTVNPRGVWPVAQGTASASQSRSKAASANELTRRLFQNALADTRWLHTNASSSTNLPWE
ncbi:hypothetical protein BDF19DRAFT_451517 [Syncephalis fuscata]|nr:hypothetical protein BDF19DRAFT_451517 [Syncephalis fuscata]